MAPNSRKEPDAQDLDDPELLTQIRAGAPSAWKTLIDRYQGRLLAFVNSRLSDHSGAEDIVQETFLGFLMSLPHYDSRTPLESFLFSIAAHKLIDAMRKSGRRPTLQANASLDSGDAFDQFPGDARRASSLVMSRERLGAERTLIDQTLRGLVRSWISRGEFERLMCSELLFVVGLPNKVVAEQLDISQQTVANHKQFVLQKLKEAAESAKLREIDWESWQPRTTPPKP